MIDQSTGVSSRMVWPWVTACRRLGLDLALDFARHGLSEGQLRDPEFRLSHSTLSSVVRCLIHRSEREDLALLAAQEVDRGYFDLLELAVRTSATLADSITCLTTFFGLVDSGVELCLRRGPEHSELVLTARPGCALHPAYPEFILAMLQLAARRETGVIELASDQVYFAHAAHGDVSPYRALFFGSVTFGATETKTQFASRWLSLPMLRANPQQQRAATQALMEPPRKVGTY